MELKLTSPDLTLIFKIENDGDGEERFKPLKRWKKK